MSLKGDPRYGWKKSNPRKPGKPYSYSRNPQLPRSPEMRQPAPISKRSDGLPEEWFSSSPYFQEAFGNSAYDNKITTKQPEAVPKRRLQKPAQLEGLDKRPVVSELVDVVVPNGQPASTSVCLSTGDEPEVSMAWACQMRDKALLEYREARAEGVAWLWKRAIHRAGGGRTISFMIFRLWANHVTFENGKRNKALKIVAMMQNRRALAPFGAWVRYARESKQLAKEAQLRDETRQREAKEQEMAKQQRIMEGLKAKVAALTKKNEELEAKLNEEDGNAKVIEHLKTDLADAEARVVSGHEAMEKLFEATDMLREEQVLAMKARLVALSSKRRGHDFRHVLSDRTKQLLGFPRTPGDQAGPLSTHAHYEERFYNGDDEDDPLVLANIDESQEEEEEGVDFGIQVAKKKAPPRITSIDLGTEKSPENLAELIVVDWVNHMSKAATQFSGNKVTQFRNVTDFGRSLKDGQQLARLLLSLFDACVDDASGSAEAEESALSERLDVPPIRPVRPFVTLDGKEQAPLLKEIKKTISDPKALVDVLVKALRKHFALPGDSVTPGDILGEKTDAIFSFLAYLMIVCPVSRNSKLAPILFDYSLLLEEMETEWCASKAKLTEVDKATNKSKFAPKKLVKAASPADAFQIHEKIKQLDKLATKVQKLDFGMAEGEKLWESSFKVVTEKMTSELSRKARNPNGFMGRISANPPF